jgi:hypothetical protein
MKKTLDVLNKLLREKIIKDYAIGGAMRAMFYAEAVTTMDLDIFVLFPDEDSLIPLTPVYEKLKEWGYLPDLQERECVNIEGIPVQFLPAYDDLLQEALAFARVFDYEGVSTKVMLAEYLALICVKTGRMKDKLRVQMLMTSDGFSMKKFMELLAKFKLTERFESWKIQ